MQHYIYNFQDFLKIKESTAYSIEDITSVQISTYRGDNEESFTLEQLKEVFSTCLYITDITVYDLEELHIPDEIECLKKLEDLSFHVKSNLSISEKIGNLSLKSLLIHTEDENFKLPSSIEKIETIQSINIRTPHFSFPNLDHWKNLTNVCLDVADFVGNFKELSKVAIQLKDCSITASLHEKDVEVIAQMENLKQLNLQLKNIQKIASLENCYQLSYFYLIGNEITAIEKIPTVSSRIVIETPLIETIEFSDSERLSSLEFIGNKTHTLHFDVIKYKFPKLKRLELKSFGNEKITSFNEELEELVLEDFPKLQIIEPIEFLNLKQIKLSKMPKLESLANFSFSKKTDLDFFKLNHLGITELPIFQSVKINEFECCQCKNVSIDNQFEFLMDIAPKSFVIPALIEVKRSQSFIFKFVLALSKSKLPLDDKRRFFELYVPYFKNYTKNKLSHTKTDILKLSSISYPPLQKQILQDISEIVKKEIVENPLSPTIKLAILGNTGTNKTVFKQRLNALGITYHGKVQEDTTHIIIGKLIKEFEISEKETWVFEETVTDFLNEGETPYLLEKSEGEINQNQENVLELLLAGGDNALLALEILSAGGVPKELLTPLLVVQKIDDDKKVKDKAKKLLIANAPVSFQAALADRGRFVITKSEKDLSKHLNQLCEKAPEIDWIEFANFYYQKHQKALPFIFDKTKKGNPIRQALFEGLIEHNCLDLFKALIKQTPDYTNYYAYESYRMREDNVPLEVFEQTDLIELSLRGFALGQVPKEIKELINLRTLDLSANLLTSLPEELKALTKLETLILSDNEFSEIPAIIGALKSLKKVTIRSNRKMYDYAFITEVSNTIKQQLPACTFVHN